MAYRVILIDFSFCGSPKVIIVVLLKEAISPSLLEYLSHEIHIYLKFRYNQVFFGRKLREIEKSGFSIAKNLICGNNVLHTTQMP
jgi:hypothetical protein